MNAYSNSTVYGNFHRDGYFFYYSHYSLLQKKIAIISICPTFNRACDGISIPRAPPDKTIIVALSLEVSLSHSGLFDVHAPALKKRSSCVAVG